MNEFQAKINRDLKNLSDVVHLIKVAHTVDGENLLFTKENYDLLLNDVVFTEALLQHRVMCDKDAADVDGYELRHSFKGKTGRYRYFYVLR